MRAAVPAEQWLPNGERAGIGRRKEANMGSRARKKSDHGRKLKPASPMMSYGYNPEWSEGSIKSAIFQTSTCVFRHAEQGKSLFAVAYRPREAQPNEKSGLIYSRINNPELEILED